MGKIIEGLFIRKLRDLNQQIMSVAEEYDALRVSALLRQLLLDGNPLMHQARNVYKQRHPGTPLDIQLQVNRYGAPDKKDWRLDYLISPACAPSYALRSRRRALYLRLGGRAYSTPPRLRGSGGDWPGFRQDNGH